MEKNDQRIEGFGFCMLRGEVQGVGNFISSYGALVSEVLMIFTLMTRGVGLSLSIT